MHHLACTGGTLLARCIACQPNTLLLSETDPYTPLPLDASPFRPSDLAYLARQGAHPPDIAALSQIYQAGLKALLSDTHRRGLALILRDHSHSKYTFGANLQPRPSLYSLLKQHVPLRALVTVRHPLDSYLGLVNAGWIHFWPATFEEYCRRQLAFLGDHADVALLRYEDFVAAPDGWMRWICDQLALDHNPDFAAHLGTVTLSGDSGRHDDQIAPRPRRTVPEELTEALGESPSYHALCRRLGYVPAADASPVMRTRRPGEASPPQAGTG